MKAYDLKRPNQKPKPTRSPPPEVPAQSSQILRPEVDYGTWRMKTGSHVELYKFITKLNELRHQYPYTIVDIVVD